MTAVADVRSVPVSGYCPHFDREPLRAALRAADVRYAFLGRELGARREEPECYDAGGVARYELIADAPLFRAGLERVRRGLGSYRVALLCAEKEPLDCHRAVLVCRHLRDVGPIAHILADGTAEPHADFEGRLVEVCRLDPADPSLTRTGWVERAYNMQAARLAYQFGGG